MIESEMLHKGNWIGYRGGYYKVEHASREEDDSIGIVIKGAGLTWVDIEEVSAIELTSRIMDMITCFKKRGEPMNYDKVTYEYYHEANLYETCGASDGTLAVLCMCRGNYYSNYIRLLHELQNHFLVVLGLDLTILMK